MEIEGIITVILSSSAVVSALSIFYGKFIVPIKNAIKQIENHDKEIQALDIKVNKQAYDIYIDNATSTEVRSLMLESLMAILDALDIGENGKVVTDTKNKLVKFLSRQV